MKPVFMITAFIGLSFGGYYKSLALYKRIDELELFIAIIEYIKDEIRFLKMPVMRIIDKITDMQRFSEYNLLLLFQERLKNERSCARAWKQTIENSNNLTKLSNEDLSVLSAFFEGLGNSDEQGQISICLAAISELKKLSQDADEYCKKHSRLYRSLGVLAGLFVCVILI